MSCSFDISFLSKKKKKKRRAVITSTLFCSVMQNGNFCTDLNYPAFSIWHNIVLCLGSLLGLFMRQLRRNKIIILFTTEIRFLFGYILTIIYSSRLNVEKKKELHQHNSRAFVFCFCFVSTSHLGLLSVYLFASGRERYCTRSGFVWLAFVGWPIRGPARLIIQWLCG